MAEAILYDQRTGTYPGPYHKAHNAVIADSPNVRTIVAQAIRFYRLRSRDAGRAMVRDITWLGWPGKRDGADRCAVRIRVRARRTLAKYGT